MSKLETASSQLKALFEPIIGEISVKTYFSYYAAFKHNSMFALLADDEIYLKITPSTLDLMLSIENAHLAKIGDKLLDDKHCRIPHEFFTTPSATTLLKTILDDLALHYFKKYIDKKNLIRYLPNMNMNLERLLIRQGIQTVDELECLGAVDAFVRIIEKGIEATPNLLFRLHGAIHRQQAEFITTETKQNLLQETEIALYKAGLRSRFYRQAQSMQR